MTRLPVIVALLLVPASAAAHELVDSARLREMWEEYKHLPDSAGARMLMGYVAGVADNAPASLCLPRRIGTRQLVETVGHFAEAPTAQHYRSGSTLVKDALRRAFPCPR